MVFGFALVHFHNIWDGSYRVIVTVIGWAIFVKGLLLILLPQGLNETYKALKLFSRGSVRNIGIFALALGLLMAYLGFILH